MDNQLEEKSSYSSSRVSIIIPVYNGEKYIGECIESLLQQTYEDVEIIVVNDGSTDTTEEILSAYAKNNNCIVYIHQENQGVSYARLKGLSVATGEYIGFVDADDYVAPQYVENLLTALQNHDCDLVCCQYIEIGNCGMANTPIRPKPGIYEKENLVQLLKTNFLYDDVTRIAGMNMYLWSKLGKRDIFLHPLETVKRIKYGEDLIAVYLMLSAIRRMCIIADSLYYYRNHQNQVTSKYTDNLYDILYQHWILLRELDKENYFAISLKKRVFNETRSILNKCLRQRGLQEARSVINSINRAYAEFNIKSLKHSFSLKEQLLYYLIQKKHVILYKLILDAYYLLTRKAV